MCYLKVFFLKEATRVFLFVVLVYQRVNWKLTFVCRVVETLKDYAVKALVNTVDHLGSVTFKVNDLLDEKVDEVSRTEFRVSCIEQVRSSFITIAS